MAYTMMDYNDYIADEFTAPRLAKIRATKKADILKEMVAFCENNGKDEIVALNFVFDKVFNEEKWTGFQHVKKIDGVWSFLKITKWYPVPF